MSNLIQLISDEDFQTGMRKLFDRERLTEKQARAIYIATRGMMERISQTEGGTPQLRPESKEEAETGLLEALFVAKTGTHVCVRIDDEVHIHVLMMCNSWTSPADCLVSFHITNDEDKSYLWIFANLERVLQAYGWLADLRKIEKGKADIHKLSYWVAEQLSVAQAGTGAPTHRMMKPFRNNVKPS